MPVPQIGSVPDADTFIRDACEYAHAADILVGTAGHLFSRIPMFLLGRGLELGYKAFLMHTGTPAEALRRRPYGHDLTGLLGGCERSGFPADEEGRTHVERFAETYSSKLWEYVDVHALAHPPALTLRDILDRTLNIVAEQVWGSVKSLNGKTATGLSVAADWSNYPV
jgi:hypothetical protein